MFGPLLGVQMLVAWQAQGIVHRVKSEQNVRHLKRIWKDACRMAGCSTRDMFIRDVGRSRADFREGLHQIVNFGKMILRDRCSTSYDLASLFRGRRATLETWTGKIAKRIGTRPSALHATFHY